MKRTEEYGLSLHDKEKGDCNEAADGDIPDNLDGVSLTAFGLPNNIVKGKEFLNGKVGSIARITVTDANADICFLDGKEVISSITNHSNFVTFQRQCFLNKFKLISLLLDAAFNGLDDQSFIFRRYPCVHFNLFGQLKIMKYLGKGDKAIINNNRLLALDVLLEC